MSGEARTDAHHGARPATGYFLFSLDTELATGHYDGLRKQRFSPDGSRERRSIKRLLEILDEFNITATWALVGHLFHERCQHCVVCPWEGQSPGFDMAYGSAHPLWYGADIVDVLLQRGARHEYAFHGYSHRVFDESIMTVEEAQFEIDEWLRLASRWGIIPKSVIFPRNRIGFLGLFKEAGFICFRGEKVMPPVSRVPLLGKALNRLDLHLQLFVPQVCDVSLHPTGMVNLHESQWLFRMSHRIERLLDACGLHLFRIRPLVQSVEKAAREQKVVHLWAHPYEFRTDKDFEKLRYLFQCVAKNADMGKLLSVSMVELAEKVIEQRPPRESEAPRTMVGVASAQRPAFREVK